MRGVFVVTMIVLAAELAALELYSGGRAVITDERADGLLRVLRRGGGAVGLGAARGALGVEALVLGVFVPGGLGGLGGRPQRSRQVRSACSCVTSLRLSCSWQASWHACGEVGLSGTAAGASWRQATAASRRERARMVAPEVVGRGVCPCGARVSRSFMPRYWLRWSSICIVFSWILKETRSERGWCDLL
jgi:hypothetical protein